MPTVPAKIDPKKLNKKGPAKEKAKTPPAVVETTRPILYPEIVAQTCLGDLAITPDRAKELLGWEVEPKKGAFGTKYLLLDSKGLRVRCSNNETNRPLYVSTYLLLKQEILRKNWRFNGEPIIIGRTGLVLNGQHTLIGLVLAAEELSYNPDSPHHELWKMSEPYIEKLVVYGVAEDDLTVNTMDTCKPRSLSDVIYRAHYFKGLLQSDQRAVSRLLEAGIKKMWERSGTYEDSYAVSRTHAESIAYLSRHPKLLDSVRHVFEEDNRENKIGKFIHRGYAAAALYMMGSCGSDSDSYYGSDHPDEKLLDWGLWDRAQQFFVELAGGSKSLKAVGEVLSKILTDYGVESQMIQWTVIVKAWNAYKDKEPVTVALLEPKFDLLDGEYHLAESPYFGGIDVGEEGLPFAELPPAELEARTEATKVKPKAPPARPKRTGQPVKSKWHTGDTGWALNEFDEPSYVTVLDEPYLDANGIERVSVSSDGAVHDIALENLSLSQYELEA